ATRWAWDSRRDVDDQRRPPRGLRRGHTRPPRRPPPGADGTRDAAVARFARPGPRARVRLLELRLPRLALLARLGALACADRDARPLPDGHGRPVRVLPAAPNSPDRLGP